MTFRRLHLEHNERTKTIVKWHGQIKLLCVNPNQNRIPTLEWGETFTPKEEASKVSLRGCAHAQSASQRVGW
jgi:hypothetical protein